MNYEELKQAVQDYLEEDETKFVANIPIFVRAVENRVYNSVQIPALRKNSLGQSSAGNRYLAMPTDFLSVFSLALIDPDTGAYAYVQQKDVNLVREVYPSPAYQATPKYFALFDELSLILGPTPDKNYVVELHYFYYPTSLVTAGESWLSTNFSSVMLYGVIAEGYRFLKGDAAQQKEYDQQYADALSLLKPFGEGKSRGDAYSNNQPKLPVTNGE